MANRTSHRYNYLPLLPSGPGGVQQELVVPVCRGKCIFFWNNSWFNLRANGIALRYIDNALYLTMKI